MKWISVTTNGLRQNRQKYKSEMDKSSLKWNSLCGVLRHNPYVIQITFGAKLCPNEVLAATCTGREQVISSISSKAASFTQISDPYSGVFNWVSNRGILVMCDYLIFELFFCKKTPLSRRVEYVMDGSMDQWVSESVSQWVRDVCMSHQLDWIYYKQPIKVLVLKVNSMWEDSIPTQFRTAIFILLWKRRKYLFPHFLWVMLRFLVMDEMGLEVWDSAWACCMQMELDIFELFFCKKIPLSRRVEYVMDGSMDQSVSEWVSESVSERCMDVTPIRSDLL